ncbi:hypothetical protein ACIU1J_30105 [Azospirillum doebereinerae]|uniref:hypothetical protein n=1 Tax=Azospirillum doebereinerae TaxID=92933 RepID=UPI001EE4EBAB|nr:hypothetical protein [Azospirillum doebereinerae]MCG5240944.1 hypothetical protein [Azospirillum doebereinerae]
MMIQPQIQPAFLEWYEDARNRFLVPVEIQRTDQTLDLILPTVTQAISATLVGPDIQVSVELDGHHWDIIRAFETALDEVRDGYACGLCPKENRKVYPTPERFWINHLFEPFLAWVNSDLAIAVAIGFWGDLETGTWAKLMTGEQADAATPRVLLPLWKG